MLCPTRFVVDATETAKKAWRPKCAAPRLGYEQKQKATYYCSYLGHHNDVTFVGGISERRPKSEPFVFIRPFRIRGPISTWEGWREGGKKGGTKRGGASCHELPEDQAISCCVHTWYQVVDRRWREEGR